MLGAAGIDKARSFVKRGGPRRRASIATAVGCTPPSGHQSRASRNHFLPALVVSSGWTKTRLQRVEATGQRRQRHHYTGALSADASHWRRCPTRRPFYTAGPLPADRHASEALGGHGALRASSAPMVLVLHQHPAQRLQRPVVYLTLSFANLPVTWRFLSPVGEKAETSTWSPSQMAQSPSFVVVILAGLPGASLHRIPK